MLGDGTVVRRHVDQTLARPEDRDYLKEPERPEPSTVSLTISDPAAVIAKPAEREPSCIPEGHLQNNPTSPVSSIPSPVAANDKPPQQTAAPVRRSQMPVSKPTYLKDYVE